MWRVCNSLHLAIEKGEGSAGLKLEFLMGDKSRKRKELLTNCVGRESRKGSTIKL